MSVVMTAEFELHGEELDINDAETVKRTGLALIADADAPIRVDLDGLTTANSVTVAVLVAWYRSATLADKTINFVNLSPELQDIIEFSGLSRVLLHASPGL